MLRLSKHEFKSNFIINTLREPQGDKIYTSQKSKVHNYQRKDY